MKTPVECTPATMPNDVAPESAVKKKTPPSQEHLELSGLRAHFVGIGGCGMQGLARIAREAGAHCTGSDISEQDSITQLRKDGFHVVLQQTAQSVPADTQLLVISAAIPPDHPELQEAQRRGVRVLKYARMLGMLMASQTGIAVSGTHGKSSTTSMTSHILIQAGMDPSVIVGATCNQIGGGARSGKRNLLVAEACEYDRSFHNLRPTKAVILNVEEDHLDTYGTLDAIIEGFHDFAELIPPAAKGGYLLIQHELSCRMKISAGLDCRVETLGFSPQADWRVEVSGAACPSVKLLYHTQVLAEWKSPMPGEHMAYNAAAAAVLSHQVAAPWPAIVAGIESFRGLDRRMQLMGRKIVAGGEVPVVDDYGHHPTEIDTTLRALRRHYDPQRLICVFQPHQHSRTRFLLDQFAVSFSQADVVIVPHIYFVRDSEQERRAISAADLVDKLRQHGKSAMHLYPFEAIVDQLRMMTRPGDLLVTMGAGDVWKVARDFLA